MSINTITTKEMLKNIGYELLSNEKSLVEAASVSPEGTAFWGAYFTTYVHIPGKGPSITTTVVTSLCSGETLNTRIGKCYAFDENNYHRLLNLYKEKYPNLTKDEIIKWERENLFLVEDYKDNASVIEYLYNELHWLAITSTTGNVKSFLNRKRYYKILEKASEWSK